MMKGTTIGLVGIVSYYGCFHDPHVVSSFTLSPKIRYKGFVRNSMRFLAEENGDNVSSEKENKSIVTKYNLGIGKHRPVSDVSSSSKKSPRSKRKSQTRTFSVNKDLETSETLAKALWDKEHYDRDTENILECESEDCIEEQNKPIHFATIHDNELRVSHDENDIGKDGPIDIDLGEVAATAAAVSSGVKVDSLSSSFSGDKVWDAMRMEARKEAEREPLLVSFLFSSILNHDSLESALAFHLANRLASPSMISTQIMSLCLEAFNNSPQLRDYLRADIMAVRERDPACTCLPDVFLYFKGFHALQTYRVANYLWKSGRRVLAHYLQSQMSQVYQIDIHPNATLGSGIMLDHGTGIVIGETAVVGDNCSLLHHVTLGGSGKKNVDRHPKIGKGVLIGAGASVLGNVSIGDGVQIGAGTLVINDLPKNSVAVGVPAKIIGEFQSSDDSMTPASTMIQLGTNESDTLITFHSESI